MSQEHFQPCLPACYCSKQSSSLLYFLHRKILIAWLHPFAIRPQCLVTIMLIKKNSKSSSIALWATCTLVLLAWSCFVVAQSSVSSLSEPWTCSTMLARTLPQRAQQQFIFLIQENSWFAWLHCWQLHHNALWHLTSWWHIFLHKFFSCTKEASYSQFYSFWKSGIPGETCKSLECKSAAIIIC